MQQAIKPELSPPRFVFPIVWTILFALMGISIARIWLKPKSNERTRAIFAFVCQLVVNVLWTLIFLNKQAYGYAFAVIILLIILILYMIYSFTKVDKLSAKLQIPYLLWVGVASYLNFIIWQIN